jgi:hypothetical protein
MARARFDDRAIQPLIEQQARLFASQRDLAFQGKAYVAGEVAKIFAATPMLDRFEATFEYEWRTDGDRQHRKCLPMARVTLAQRATSDAVLTTYLARAVADCPDDIEDMELQFWTILDESGVLDHFGKALDTGASTAQFTATREAFERYCVAPDIQAAVAIATCT